MSKLWPLFFVLVCCLSLPIIVLFYEILHDFKIFVFPPEQVTSRLIYQLNRHVVKPRALTGVDYLKIVDSCSIIIDRERAFKSFKWWIKFTAIHNITWWLDGGTLIGALRYEDVIPYDLDMDIGFIVTPRVNRLLRKTSVKVPVKLLRNNDNSTFLLVGMDIENPRNCSVFVNCNGTRYRSLSDYDQCVFCGPSGRIFTTAPNKVSHIDLFAARLLKSDKKMHRLNSVYHFMYDETGYLPLIPTVDIFPLTLCNFMGMSMPCPRGRGKYLEHNYPLWNETIGYCFDSVWRRKG